MRTNQLRFYLAMLVALLLVAACSKEPVVTAPNEVVVKYLDALYNERDFDKALSLASEHHQMLLNNHGTTSTVGRYLYNMSFEQAIIQAERPSGMTYRNNANSLRIDVAISGFSHGKRFDEVREVIVVFEEGRWKVDRMIDSPY